MPDQPEDGIESEATETLTETSALPPTTPRVTIDEISNARDSLEVARKVSEQEKISRPPLSQIMEEALAVAKASSASGKSPPPPATASRPPPQPARPTAKKPVIEEVVSVSNPTAPISSEQRLQKMFHRAEALADASNFREAEAQYQRVHAAEPNFLEAYVARAKMYEAQGRLEAAQQLYQYVGKRDQRDLGKESLQHAKRVADKIRTRVVAAAPSSPTSRTNPVATRTPTPTVANHSKPLRDGPGGDSAHSQSAVRRSAHVANRSAG